jgi:hypothetical protein
MDRLLVAGLVLGVRLAGARCHFMSPALSLIVIIPRRIIWCVIYNHDGLGYVVLPDGNFDVALLHNVQGCSHSLSSLCGAKRKPAYPV